SAISRRPAGGTHRGRGTARRRLKGPGGGPATAGRLPAAPASATATTIPSAPARLIRESTVWPAPRTRHGRTRGLGRPPSVRPRAIVRRVTSGRTEVAVIGAGVIGLAAADALGRSGAQVRAFERAAPGSAQSGGLTRIFRHVHFRRDLVELVARARAAWGEWEARAGRRLLGEEGTLYVGADLEEV